MASNDRLALPLGAMKALQERFLECFQVDPAICRSHAQTLTWLPSQPPWGVIFCLGKEDVCDAVQICGKHAVPIVPFGAGTSLEGQVNAPYGGISLDLSRMNQLVGVSHEDMCAVVQPGMTKEALNSVLHDSGLFFPVDPGAVATLGGMASTRASGTNAVRYGTMRENTLALEVVLAHGEIIRTGSKARKSSSGYDLTHLFVGAEGTLGVITELTLRLYPLPEAVAGGRCTFDTIARATNAVVSALTNRIDFARIELLDSLCIRAFKLYGNLEIVEAPSLFVEFHGDPHHVKHQAERFHGIVVANGGSAYDWTTNQEERLRLWAARRDAWWAIHKMFPGRRGVATDVCVPISRLSDCIAMAQSDIGRLGLDAPIIGHVGDGNFHVLIMLDEQDPVEIAKAKELISRLNQTAIEMGGTCTGEHGVGQGKITHAAIEHGSALATMRAIKHALDPANLLNPGKMFT